MTWEEYKTLCDRPDYWSRWMLEVCAELLHDHHAEQLATALQAVLTEQPLQQPADFKGPAAVHMFQIQLSPQQRAAVLSLVQQAVAAGWRNAATATRGLGGFVEAWQEYVGYAETD
ncbi:MAG: hypothetical protein AAF529_15685 [Pseudomonadota bacterium]